MGKDKDKEKKVGANTIDGKPMKLPPGIKGKDSKSAQANKVATVEDTNDNEWLPMQPVVLDLSDKVGIHYSEEENYRAYKLFNIIDTSGTVYGASQIWYNCTDARSTGFQYLQYQYHCIFCIRDH